MLMKIDGPRPPYELSRLVAMLVRQQGQPAAAEVKAEPEDERHWVRQPAEPVSGGNPNISTTSRKVTA
jgi:hypothetical protein